jgi:hypothetical protein
VCDRRLKTKDGWVSGFKMVPIIEQSNIALLAINKTVDINEYHKQLGHPNISVTRVKNDIIPKKTCPKKSGDKYCCLL